MEFEPIGPSDDIQNLIIRFLENPTKYEEDMKNSRLSTYTIDWLVHVLSIPHFTLPRYMQADTDINANSNLPSIISRVAQSNSSAPTTPVKIRSLPTTETSEQQQTISPVSTPMPLTPASPLIEQEKEKKETDTSPVKNNIVDDKAIVSECQNISGICSVNIGQVQVEQDETKSVSISSKDTSSSSNVEEVWSIVKNPGDDFTPPDIQIVQVGQKDCTNLIDNDQKEELPKPPNDDDIPEKTTPPTPVENLPVKVSEEEQSKPKDLPTKLPTTFAVQPRTDVIDIFEPIKPKNNAKLTVDIDNLFSFEEHPKSNSNDTHLMDSPTFKFTQSVQQEKDKEKFRSRSNQPKKSTERRHKGKRNSWSRGVSKREKIDDFGDYREISRKNYPKRHTKRKGVYNPSPLHLDKISHQNMSSKSKKAISIEREEIFKTEDLSSPTYEITNQHIVPWAYFLKDSLHIEDMITLLTEGLNSNQVGERLFKTGRNILTLNPPIIDPSTTMESYNLHRKQLEEKYICVLRDSKFIMINISGIVPGDFVYLKAGCNVPADIRVMASINATCELSSLTGDNQVDFVTSVFVDDLPYSSNLVFAGSHILTGEILGIVFRTSKSTTLLQIAANEQKKYHGTIEKLPFKHTQVQSILSVLDKHGVIIKKPWPAFSIGFSQVILLAPTEEELEQQETWNSINTLLSLGLKVVVILKLSNRCSESEAKEYINSSFPYPNRLSVLHGNAKPPPILKISRREHASAKEWAHDQSCNCRAHLREDNRNKTGEKEKWKPPSLVFFCGKDKHGLLIFLQFLQKYKQTVLSILPGDLEYLNVLKESDVSIVITKSDTPQVSLYKASGATWSIEQSCALSDISWIGQCYCDIYNLVARERYKKYDDQPTNQKNICNACNIL